MPGNCHQEVLFYGVAILHGLQCFRCPPYAASNLLKRLKQPEFPKVLWYSCKKSLSCYGRCKMVSVRGVKQPSSCYTRKFWLHFTLWSRPWHRWVHTHSPGLAVTSSHNHHVGTSANRLDAGVFLKELWTLRSCWQMGCAGILLRVIWADSLDLSSPSHPDSLRKGKHRTHQGKKRIQPIFLLAWLLNLCTNGFCHFVLEFPFYKIGIIALNMYTVK